MLAPLSKLFKVLGIKGFEDLKPHERATYERYAEMLRSETKIEDLRKFLKIELDRLRTEREALEAIPGDRIDNERLAQIRVVKGMLGEYGKTENLKKQAEAEIEKTIKNISSKKV